MEQRAYYLELGQNIRTFRRMRNMTQKQLAMDVHKSLACISKYEKGDIAIDIFTLQAIADRFGISVSQLLPTVRDDKAAPATDALQIHPIFKNRHIYLYWYRGGKRSLVRHVIEIDHQSAKITCYMEVDDPSNYKDCRYMMYGDIWHHNINTYIYAQNAIMGEDFIFGCFSNVDLLDSQMVGFLSCMNRSCHITSTKCFISTSSRISNQEIIDAVLVTKEEINEFKKSNFYTFGANTTQF